MKKIRLTTLKKMINEAVKDVLLEQTVPMGEPITAGVSALGGHEPPGPLPRADMEFNEEEAIAGSFQALINLMTNIGALMDNPNTARPSLTSTIASGDRATETRIVSRINAQHRQLVVMLRQMASDRSTYEPTIRAGLNRALATARNVMNGMRALADQPGAQQIAAIREFKRQYIATTGALRSARARYKAFAQDYAPPGGGTVRDVSV